jgi:hypothetical protein
MDNVAIQERSEMDLVNIINGAEDLAWRLNHDAADGRIPEAGVDDSISQLMKQRDEAVTELKLRTGIQTHEEIIDYIRGKLEEQNQMWNKQWGELYQEGAVFKSSGNDRVFETVRLYLPTSGTFGPNQIILARSHDSSNYFRFDNRNIPHLIKLDDVQPQYKGETRSGIIRATEEMAKREVMIHQKSNRGFWYQFHDIGAVFTHAGFNDTYESFAHFNLPNKERKISNEVILARSYSQPLFVEFTLNDLGAMELIEVTPRYARREGVRFYPPKLTLER